MELSKIIKNKYLNKFLNTHKVLRKKQIVSLDNAKSIGILAEITDENSYKQIYTLFTKLQSLEKSVWLMCYVNEKSVPYYCLQQLTADYFCKKNLNWFGKPDFVQMKDFLAKEFDMLLDFNTNAYQPNEFILSQTNSKFIIGTIKEFQPLYDLYIETENNKDQIELLKHIHHYSKKLTGE